MVIITQRKNNITNINNTSNTKKNKDLLSSDDDSESENEKYSDSDSVDEYFNETQKGGLGKSAIEEECRYTDIKTVMERMSKLDQDILVDGLTVWAGFAKRRKLFKFKRWIPFAGIRVGKVKSKMVKLDKYFKCVAENKLPIENTKFNPDLLEELKPKKQIRIALALIFAACRTSKMEQASTQGVADALITLQKAIKPSKTISVTPETNKPGAEKTITPATTSIDEGKKQELISEFILLSPNNFYIVYDTDGKGKSELPFKPVNFAQVIELLYNKLVSRSIEKEKAKLRSAKMEAQQYTELQKIRTETQQALEKLPGQGLILDLKSEYTSIYTSYDAINKEYEKAEGYNKGSKTTVTHTEHIEMLNKVNSVILRINKFIVDYTKLSSELKTQLPTEFENIQKMKVKFEGYKLNIENLMKISDGNTIPTKFNDINQLKKISVTFAKLLTPVEIQKMGVNIRFIPNDAFKQLTPACIDILTVEQLNSLQKDIFSDLSDEFTNRMVNYLEVVRFTPGSRFSKVKLDEKAVAIINLANKEKEAALLTSSTSSNLFTKLFTLIEKYQYDENSNFFKFLVEFPDLNKTQIGIKILNDLGASKLAIKIKGSGVSFKPGSGESDALVAQFNVINGRVSGKEITAEIIKNIAATTFASIIPDKFAQIPADSFKEVDAAKAKVVTADQAKKLTKDQLVNLSANALNALEDTAVKNIIKENIKLIPPNTFKELDNFLQNMSSEQVNEIEQNQFDMINTDVTKLNKITHFGSIPLSLFKTIPQAQINNLEKEIIAKIVPMQINVIDIDNINNNTFAFLSIEVFKELITNQDAKISQQKAVEFAKNSPLLTTLNNENGIIVGKILVKCTAANAQDIAVFINKYCNVPLIPLTFGNNIEFVKGIFTEITTNIAVNNVFADAIIKALTNMAKLANFANSDYNLGKLVGELMIKAGDTNANHSVAFIAHANVAVGTSANFIKGIFDTITDKTNHNNNDVACATFANAFLGEHANLAVAPIINVPQINEIFAKLIYAAGENIEQKAFVKYAAIAGVARGTNIIVPPAPAANPNDRVGQLVGQIPVSIVQTAQIVRGPGPNPGDIANSFKAFTIPNPGDGAAGPAAAGGANATEDVKRVVNSICFFINGNHGAVPDNATPAGLKALYDDLFNIGNAIVNNGQSLAVQANIGQVRGSFANWANIQQFINAAVAAPAVADSIVSYIATTEVSFQAGGSKNRSYRVRKLKKSKTNNKKSKKYHSRKQNHMTNNKYNNKHNNKYHSIKNKSTKHNKTKRH